MSHIHKIETLIQESSIRTGQCLILYGSHGRGDFEPTSDIDILRVDDDREHPTSSIEPISLYTYSTDQLRYLAEQGSLFVLHLINESVPLYDPYNFISGLADTFRPPSSYLWEARHRLSRASMLMLVNESLFRHAPGEFTDVAIFLCRSLLYAELADRGPFSFSLRDSARENKIAALLCEYKKGDAKFSRFEELSRVIGSQMQRRDQRVVSSWTELSVCTAGDPLSNKLIKKVSRGDTRLPYDWLK